MSPRVTRSLLCLCLAATACEEAEKRELPKGPPAPEQPDPPHLGAMTIRVGEHRLEPGEETVTCWSRTLNNEAPLYIEEVQFANLGSFHHSNWFVVPDDVFPGEDGTWDCAERGFDEISAALSGAVLFAQSTQAWEETQSFRDTEGVVIKIPAHAKIVADLHLLNLAPTERETEAYLTLHAVHPWFVNTVLKPMMLAYYDLHIPAEAESRFSATCTGITAENLHYALPHYHSTGNFFSLELVDEVSAVELFEVDGFSADVVGQSFPSPLPFAGYEGVRFTCGYDNWMNQELVWGIGANEMCVMLGLVEGPEIVTGVVFDGKEEVTDVVDGVRMFEGECNVLTAPTGDAYALPRISELAAPFYLPPPDPRDEGAPVVPECVDADRDAEPAVAPTLANLREHVFEPWCTFSACHGESAAAALDLRADDVEAQLRADVVVPGKPEQSLLYEVLSRCEPSNATSHMPRNAPVLLDDSLVAMVRAWIENLPEE